MTKVKLEGEKEKIIELYEELKKEKPEFFDLEFNADLIVPDSMMSSQALMLEQLGKRDCLYCEADRRNKWYEEGSERRFGKLPERIAEALKE